MPSKRTTSKDGTRASNKPLFQVFVSHATADKWLARTICEKIESVGATTFRDDRDIAGGDVIPNEIRKHIRQSRELVVLLTPESRERTWVIAEIGAAWGRRADYRIVPILCHVTTDAIPGIIKEMKAFHLNEFDQYLGELTERVKK